MVHGTPGKGVLYRLRSVCFVVDSIDNRGDIFMRSEVRIDQWNRGYIITKTKFCKPYNSLTCVISSWYKHGHSMEELAKRFNCSLSLIEDAIRFELKNVGGRII